MKRQALNVFRMKLCGAEVRAVDAGEKTLKEAINEAMRDWVTNVRDTHYILGSALRRPSPTQKSSDFIGGSVRRLDGRYWRKRVGCRMNFRPASAVEVTSMGLFWDFLEDDEVRLVGSRREERDSPKATCGPF